MPVTITVISVEPSSEVLRWYCIDVAVALAPGGLQYFSALRGGHSVHALIHETYGGFGKGCVALLYELGRKHGERRGADELTAPWCAPSFRSLWAMRISVALHTATAEEIVSAVQVDTATA